MARQFIDGRLRKARDVRAPLKGDTMLYWALVFFIVSIVAAVFGFGGISEATAGIAQILFYVFLVFFVISLVAGLAGGGRRSLR
jgi:uncharacterized membrane protein YtjA (UPF0391 family)